VGSAPLPGHPIPHPLTSILPPGSPRLPLYEAGRKALDAGAIPGHDMVSETAFTKLMWALGNFPNNLEKIKMVMLSDIAGEISSVKTPKEKRIWEYAL